MNFTQKLIKNKTLVISETKENKFKSISEGVEYVHLFPKNLKILIKNMV